VLVRAWHRRGQFNLGQRRNDRYRIAKTLALAALLFTFGCKGNQRASLDQQYTEARRLFQQGYTDQSQNSTEHGDHDSANFPDLNWKFRILQAEIHIRKSKPEKALELLLSSPPALVSNDVLWRRKLLQALATCQIHSFADANQYFSDAEHLAGEQNDLRAELAFFRGRCAVAKGDLGTAELLFRRALAASSVDGFVRAWSSANLGLCAKLSRHFEDAADWYVQAQSAFATLKAPPLEQTMLGNLGYVYFELHDLPKAKESTEKAAGMAEALKLLPDQQSWLLDLGRVQQALGQIGEAEESYKKALSILMPPGSPAIAINCLNNLTNLELARGRVASAEKYHQAALELHPEGERLLFWQMDDTAIAEAHGKHEVAEAALLKLLEQVNSPKASDEQPDYRLIWLIQAKLAHVYAAEKKDQDADLWFQRSIATIKQAADTMKHAQFSAAILGNMPVFDDYVAFLISHGEEVKALQVAQSGRARTLAQGLGFSSKQGDPKIWLAKIQAFLRPQKAVVLSYFASQKECYLWTITPNQIKLSTLGIAGPDLDNLIDDYRREIKLHVGMDASPAAKKLFQVLVRPASDLIPKDSHVIIVADSKIYSVNFETLIAMQGEQHYWIDDVSLQNASSIDLLMAGNRKKTTSAKGLLLIGASVQVDPNFPELPNATKEMDSVSKHFGTGEIKRFSGKDARPSAYFSSSPGNYRYIYFATHGKSNAVDALDSAIILSPDTDGSFKLFARDIINDKLHLNADLVTISACEGAGTNVQSLEGLLGLEWAFMRAGAHQVVAALWNVDDAATPGLMDDFYGQLKQGKSAADALRHAKLAMLHAGGIHATPYYWAALQLYTRS
jgi:CHAT domain-containing protein